VGTSFGRRDADAAGDSWRKSYGGGTSDALLDSTGAMAELLRRYEARQWRLRAAIVWTWAVAIGAWLGISAEAALRAAS